ncbi:MAG: NAD(P)-dependent oxidoreductase [Monoglobaceae bacterium]
MKITILDAATLGCDIKEKAYEIFGKFGEVDMRETTTLDQVPMAAKDADVLIVNKIRIGSNLSGAKNLKLICVSATGYDNIDLKWCRENNVAVCNVKGYSTQSVAQLTISMALMLINRMTEYTEYVKSGEYSASGIANRLTPVYNEIYGKTWGIIGAGNIGKQVARVAEAMGCRVIVNKRTPDGDYEFADIDNLCATADIISVHTPLTEETRNLINRDRINMMKSNAIFINVARGAVADEAALADAVAEGRIGGIGIDVYTEEPIPKDHPYTKIMKLPNVCLTPHNAWGAYESRVRCIEIMGSNIEKFLSGERQNRIV